MGDDRKSRRERQSQHCVPATTRWLQKYAARGRCRRRKRDGRMLDEFIAGDDWRFHDVLSQAVPETNGRRADHAFSAKTRERETSSFACFRVSDVAGIDDPALLC